MTRYDDLKFLVDQMTVERGVAQSVYSENASLDEMWTAFRTMVNLRDPLPAGERFLKVQDRVLRDIIDDFGIVDAADLPVTARDPRIAVWLGDITTLGADAIVNAANSRLLGCWQPGHHCIDNAIHTFAGVQLRYECHQIMTAQGHEEGTGLAKVTQAYNLPAKHIIHTVGPIVDGKPSKADRKLLAQCYESCLDAAAERNLQSIAFCCISTGVFGFPQGAAAEVAVQAVLAWLDANPQANLKVVFNVFTTKDQDLYDNLLGA